MPETETSITIREIDSNTEIHAVEYLQKEVWGIPDIEVVPQSHLVATIAAGGVLLGAFDDGNLVGFVYGFVSYEHGRAAHHSHMLAVKSEYRNYNLGARLKLAQREIVLKQGLKVMSWTFDPLQSLNAYFNFNKLGVISNQYFVDFYGAEAASFLHQNSTDRFWVTWNLASRRVVERLNKTNSSSDLANVKTIIRCGENDIPQIAEFDNDLPEFAVEIPADINDLQEQNIKLAVEWREATRKVFTEAIKSGYIIRDFYRGQRQEQKYGVYLLSREKGFFDYEEE